MRCLSEMLAGVPADEVRAILAGNAYRIHGFDLAELDRIAASVGPELSDPEGAASA